jgi:hypothetical protein
MWPRSPTDVIEMEAHSHSWDQERSLALYGNDCAQSEADEDLRKRAAKYRVNSAARQDQTKGGT